MKYILQMLRGIFDIVLAIEKMILLYVEKVGSIKILLIISLVVMYIWVLDKTMPTILSDWRVCLGTIFFNASFLAWVVSYLLKLRKEDKLLKLNLPFKDKE